MTGSEIFFFISNPVSKHQLQIKLPPRKRNPRITNSKEKGHVTESNSQCRLGNYEMENIKSQGKGISLFPYFLFQLISVSAFGLLSSISSNLITTIYFGVQSSPQQTFSPSEGSLETQRCMLLLPGVPSPHPVQEWNNKEQMWPQFLLQLKLSLVNQLAAQTVK